MDEIVKWRWPTAREAKLYAFVCGFALVGLEVMLVSEVGMDWILMCFTLLVGLAWAPVVLLAYHLVRLFMLRGGSDRWS